MKKFFCLSCLFLWCVLFSAALQAQTYKSISGIVSDTRKIPLEGVTVYVDKTTIGTVTGSDGTFSLLVPVDSVTVSVSALGYKTRNIDITGKTFFNVVLEEEAYQLEEAVVDVGYGYVRKSDLTGSVSSVDSKISEGRIVTSIDDALKGHIAGVSIVSHDGEPGAGVDIKIRGANSISASNTPLYVIDGIPYDTNDETLGSFDYWQFGTTSNNPMNSISPGDIESIEILKDASATAIYGARGVNGVILITTKKGKIGKASVEYSGNVGFSTINRRIEMMNGAEYAKFMFDLKGGYAAAGNEWIDFAEYAKPGAVSTDWQSEIFRLGLTNDHRLSISGGNENIRYALMGSLFDQKGAVLGSGFKRYTGRLNLSANLARNLTMDVNLSASHSYKDGIANGIQYGPIAKALQASPLMTVEDLNTETSEGDAVFNPIADALTSVKDNTIDSYQLATSFAWKFLNDFTLKVRGAYLDKKQLNEGFIDPINPRSKTDGTASISQYSTSKLLGEATLTYYKRINKKHRITAMIGTTVEQYTTKGHSISTGNFDEHHLGIDNIGLGNSVKTPSSEKFRSALLSFIGRINYNYLERYLFTVTFRADGSSKFPSNNKFAPFPSAAFAWRINQEEFMKNASWINNLKLRLSYGVVGNQAIPAYSSLGMLLNSKITVDGNSSVVSFYPENIENDNLRWESTYQYNAGLDIGLFNDRIMLVADFYYKKTKDLLLQMNAPKYSGFSNYWTNAGSVQNMGVEFSLNTVNIETKNFTWTTNFNISHNRSKVLSLGMDDRIEIPGDAINATGSIGIIKTGKPFGLFYGYISDGVWKSDEEIAQSGILNQLGTSSVDLKPGYPKYKDCNGDHVIDDSDKRVIGHGEPVVIGGFNNMFRYRNFDLTVNTEFSIGGDLFNAKRIMLENTSSGSNQSKRMVNRYRPSYSDGTITDPGNENSTIHRADSPVNLVAASEYIEDGSYLRISDIILGYTFRPVKSWKATLKVYLSAKNVYVFSDYLGYDPEVNTGQVGYRSLMPGIDCDSYPKATTYTIGLNIKF